jgi:hypothetical protein
MSIVGRGLGRGAAAILVTAGLGLSSAPVEPPSPQPMLAYLAGDNETARYYGDDREMFEIALAVITSGALDP